MDEHEEVERISLSPQLDCFDTVRLTSKMLQSDGWPPREPSVIFVGSRVPKTDQNVSQRMQMASSSFDGAITIPTPRTITGKSNDRI
jgi:hypothetical protein